MSSRPPKTSRYRPMTVGQVASVVGVPRETLRTWLRDEAFDSLRQDKQEGGWRRFTDFEAICIGTYGGILECSQDHNAARVGMLFVAEMIMNEWVEVEGGVYFSDATFEKDIFMFFWRDGEGVWNVETVEMGDGFSAAMNARIDKTYEDGPSFLVVNLGAVLKSVLMSLLEVQIEMGDAK